MDDVKRKVLLDLFVSPTTIVPVAAGLSAWMLSWAGDGNLILNLAGLVGVLGGLGMFATRLIFGLEKITENAFLYLNEQQRAEQEARLDRLEEKLGTDNDPRTETCLRDLRTMHASFQQDIVGRGTGPTRAIQENVTKLFQAAVKHLEHSYHLWETASKVSDGANRPLLAERDAVIREVQETVGHLGRTIERLHAYRLQQTESELKRLRNDLDETLSVARRAEERVAKLDQETSYDPAEFE